MSDQPTDPMTVALLEMAADSLPVVQPGADADADQAAIRRLAARFETGAPPLSTEPERLALRRALPMLRTVYGEKDVRVRAVHWMAERTGAIPRAALN